MARLANPEKTLNNILFLRLVHPVLKSQGIKLDSFLQIVFSLV